MTRAVWIALALLPVLVACPSADEPAPHDWGPVRAWDAPAEAPPCALDDAAPLLDEVLAHAGLTQETFGLLPADWDAIPGMFRPELDDVFLLPWHQEWRDHPLRSGCREGELSARVDGFLDSAHGVAGTLREAAARLDRFDDGAPLDPATDGSADLESAISNLCAVAGGACDLQGEVPEDLGWALVPILDAITHALETRYGLDDGIDWSDADGDWDAQELHERGGYHLLLSLDGGFDPDVGDVEDFLRARSARSRMYRAGARLAYAVEDAGLAAFAGRMGVEVDIETDAGRISIRDASDHVYELEAGDEPEDVLFHLDLGGNDTWRAPAGANTSAVNAVSVVVDLGGDDLYTYSEYGTGPDFLLPPDDFGRINGYQGYPNSRQSLSGRGRQGAGLYGFGMLFDLGAGDDVYRSLRMSQGYAHVGVGVLRDDGGDDSYACEADCQGAGQWGIGLLSDGGGTDSYTSISQSQGFAWVAGAGWAIDGGGDDSWDCDHGHPDYGGTPGIYPSPQMPDDGNSSFCQGSGFGARNDAWSGGFGYLRDRAGDDSYSASTFSQGGGYWQGTGLLADGDGADSYEAFYYVQGGAAHYALGILADDGAGADTFNVLREPRYMQMGAGHDFSTGVLLNEAGDDEYRFGGLAMGASNCNGVGLVVDAAGDDAYSSSSDYGWGMGNVSGECIDSRPYSRSQGIMVDAGGADSYDAPATGAAGWVPPAENSLWGYARNGLESEHGGGIDGEGEAGVHPGGS